MANSNDSGIDTGDNIDRDSVIKERGDTNRKSDDGVLEHHGVEPSGYPSQEQNREIINDKPILVSDEDPQVPYARGEPNPKLSTEGSVARRELTESITQTKMKTHGHVEEGPYKGQLAGGFGGSLDHMAARKFVENRKVQFQENNDRDGRPILASDLNARLPEVDANQRMITIQTPACTVYFRKKGFRAIADAWGRSKGLIKAQKLLLKMKAKQIAAIENLTKFETIYGVDGNKSTKRFDAAANHFRMFFYDDDNLISPPAEDFNGGTLDVSGVLEITNFTTLNTQLSLNTGDVGSFSMTLEDPYNLMYVSQYDINLVLDMLEGGENEVTEVDKKYLYDFVAGRSFITVMDSIFIWIATRGERITISELDAEHSGRFGTTGNQLKGSPEALHRKENALNKEVTQGQMDLDRARADGDIGAASDAENTIGAAENERAGLPDKNLISSGSRDYLEGNDSRTDSKDLFGEDMVRQTNIDRQVFEGVVTSVQEAYSDGKHTVTVSGTNVLHWLNINRSIVSPSVVEPYGALDNPILPDGTWKHGVWAVAGSTLSTIFTDVPGQTLSSEEFATRHGIPNSKYPLNRFDSGGVITKAVTGIDVTPELLISLGDPQNVFLREVNPEKLINGSVAKGDEEQSQSNFWQTYTHQVQGQNRANGWFVPFGLMPPDVASQTFHSFDRDNPESLKTEIATVETKIQLLEKGLNDVDGKPSRTGELLKGERIVLDALKIRLDAAKSNNSDPVPTEPIQPDILKMLQKYSKTATDNTAVIGAIDNLSADTLANDPVATQTVKKVAMWLNDRQENILEPSRADVVFNLDTNFLVVDLTYLQNPDIRVYNYNVPQAENMWQTDTQTPLDICIVAAKQLDWEFFADEAGNIRFRLPQYNSMPLKVYNDYILPAISETGEEAERRWQLQRDLAASRGTFGPSPPPDAQLESDLADANRLRAQAGAEAETPRGAWPLDERTKAKWRFIERNEDIKRRIVKNDSRLYVTDDQIVTWSFQENGPEFTRINVSGEWKFELELNTYPPYLVGAASDFDLWFHYGYRKVEERKKFLRDSASQCRPYAQQLLARQRQNILRGQITIIGNPGYRMGDVIFIESRGILFYVSAVSQNFAWGQGYNTTLTLTYGHAPGVWIANPWDISSAGMWRDPVEDSVFFRSDDPSATGGSRGTTTDPTVPEDPLAPPPKVWVGDKPPPHVKIGDDVPPVIGHDSSGPFAGPGQLNV